MDNRTLAMLFVYAVCAALLFAFHQVIRDAIEDFWDNFPRGGPRTPMHPSPADDQALTRRKRAG